MPGPTATAGVVGVPCSSATNHRNSGAERQRSWSAGVGCSQVQNPPEVPPCPRGDAAFIERDVATGMKSSVRTCSEPSGKWCCKRSESQRLAETPGMGSLWFDSEDLPSDTTAPFAPTSLEEGAHCKRTQRKPSCRRARWFWVVLSATPMPV